jgi:hypothetical protein
LSATTLVTAGIHASEYPPNANVVIHPYNWRWHEGDRYAWKEHAGRGYWQGDQWQVF